MEGGLEVRAGGSGDDREAAADDVSKDGMLRAAAGAGTAPAFPQEEKRAASNQAPRMKRCSKCQVRHAGALFLDLRVAVDDVQDRNHDEHGVL